MFSIHQSATDKKDMRSIKTSIDPSKIIFGLFLLLGFTVSSFNAVAQQLLKLHYDKPAQNWNEALPLGNGRLGLMAFGNPEKEHLQLNEETVWAGEPGNNVPVNTSSQINEIRNLLFQGKNQQAQALSNQTFPRQAPADLNYGMPYQTVGDLWITFPGHQNYSNYYRDLDISNATSTVSYQVDHTTFTRKVFASLTDDVIVMKITADKPNSINFTLGLSSTQKDHQIKNDGSYLQLSGNSGSVDNKKGKIKFEALVAPLVQGGLVNKTDSSITVSKANSVIFYISIATNFKNYKDLTAEPLVKAKSILNKAIAKKYDEALATHQKKYQSFFNRVTLELGDSEQSKKTTDVRVREFADHKDPQLVALYFQFGRYLLISSSQPGGQPANLQGIWNDKNSPPWDSKYTVNINTEMNYWPAEITNLSEMHEPLFSMLKDLATTGKESASQMYHARGWNMHHNTDLWRITGIVDGGFYGMWPMGGAWLTQHLWQHYLFTGDDKFLRENYPILKGAAMFYLDVLKEEPKTKWLVMAPSMSPENTYEKNVGVAAGTTMDNQLIFDTFNNLINAAKILKTDGSFSDSVSTALAKMPPMQIGKYNQLQEWLQDLDRPDDKHRHISHLYGLYPSGQISPFRNPQLLEAAKNSLIYRGDKSTGWSMGWKVNWWARMLDGNKAYKLISDQLTPAPMETKGQSGGTYPNLLDAHPPFQIDGNFGCTAGIAEMLLQSYDGNIYVLPALPDALASGKITGLKARGGFEVDMEWKDGKLKKLIVQSTIGGNCRLRLSDQVSLNGNAKLVKSKGENTNKFYQVNKIKSPMLSTEAKLKGIAIPKTNLFDFDTVAGKKYIFNAR